MCEPPLGELVEIGCGGLEGAHPPKKSLSSPSFFSFFRIEAPPPLTLMLIMLAPPQISMDFGLCFGVKTMNINTPSEYQEIYLYFLR